MRRNLKFKNNNNKDFVSHQTITQKQSGFTIIETMIAVGLFTIIITIGIEALLNTTLLHQKSQDERSIMDNLSFIMEDMSKNIRTGSDYHCIDDGNFTSSTTHSCIYGGSGMSFLSSSGNRFVYVVYPDGSIQKSTAGGTPGTFTPLTPSEVKIDQISGFFINGAEEPPDTGQPYVTIRLSGQITSSKGNIVTPFSLQTGVSQRLVDIAIILDEPLYSDTAVDRIASANDDAEEAVSTGEMDRSSGDLEISLDASNGNFDPELVGMRFRDIDIPQGATIDSAKIQFRVDDTNGANTSPITIRFYGEDTNDASSFSSSSDDISDRTRTSAYVDWTVPSWTSGGDEGASQLSADLKTIIQEIVDRPGWSSGNDLVIMITDIVSGSGHREAESSDGDTNFGPEITIDYSVWE